MIKSYYGYTVCENCNLWIMSSIGCPSHDLSITVNFQGIIYIPRNYKLEGIISNDDNDNEMIEYLQKNFSHYWITSNNTKGGK